MLKKLKFARQLIKFLLSGLTIFLVFNCIKEEVQPPLVHNIQLTIKGSDIYYCKGDSTVSPADVSVVLKQQTDKGTTDISAFNLGTTGIKTVEIPKSQFGISNLVLEATYEDKNMSKTYEFLCCDTTLNLVFRETCNTLVIDCGDLDRTIDLLITNKAGNCITVGLPEEKMDNNVLTVIPNGRMRFDMTEAITMQTPFYTDPNSGFNPKPDANGKIELNNQNLSVIFYALAQQAGTAVKTINIPVECLDADGKVDTSGVIKVNLRAEICDDLCNCPFPSGQQIYSVSFTGTKYPLNTTTQFPENPVVTISPGMLSPGCYLEITDIKRWSNTSVPASSIPGNMDDRYDWIITSYNSNVGQKLRSGEPFKMSASFRPNSSGFSRDTFIVYTNVYSDEIGLKANASPCTFLVEFVAEGCVAPDCPALHIKKTIGDVIRYKDGKVDATYNYGNPVIPMQSGTYLKQNLTGQLGSLCTNISSNAGWVQYNIFMGNLMESLCSPISIRITPGGGSDDKYFTYSPLGSTQFFGLDSIRLFFRFNTPSFETYKSSGHDKFYNATFTVEALKGDGSRLCSQEIRLTAEVQEVSLVFSLTQSLKSFSQVSGKTSEPSYLVYKVDFYNADYVYWGAQSKLNPALGTVTTSGYPRVPINNNNTFYFDVDEPNNKNLLQNPNLYLVNSPLNTFSRITSYPVAKYSNNDEFTNDAERLIKQIMTPPGFTSNLGRNFTFTEGATIMWNPSYSATDLSPFNGIKNVIKPQVGEVYVIWDPNYPFASQYINGTWYKGMCRVALLFIDAVQNGDNTAHNISNVSFLVAYPVNPIKM